jgi:FMN phosphatase YigB (HAD superfamily)
MPDVLVGTDRLRALIFDVDGTLYPQPRIRRVMAARLLRAHWSRPWAAVRVSRVLGAYRHAQETLRRERFCGDVAAAQRDRAADRTRSDPADVADLARQWMDDLPLDVIARSPRRGLGELLDRAAARGLRLAAVSDYPADRKLEALGIADRFDVVLCAQDPRVRALKPDPRGLLLALELLGVDGAAAIYVGDRADVDAPAAAAARMRCVLVGTARRRRVGAVVAPRYADFLSLANALDRQ